MNIGVGGKSTFYENEILGVRQVEDGAHNKQFAKVL